MRLVAAVLLLLVGAVLGFAVAGRFGDPASRLLGRDGDVATIASASLRAAQRQARISTFAARFTTVITSEERRMGLSATRTLIAPGTVRYEIDLARLTPAGLQWNARERVLLVNAPQIEIAGPEVDMGGLRTLSSGGILMALTNTEDRLDQANRGAIAEAMRKEAAAPTLRAMAKASSRDAVARLFALPLGAAGIEAKVVVRFPDEAGRIN